ncbi:MAG TPA: hypothetical protein VGB03_06355, partial [Acidimicrobiales bacterium]
GTTAPTGGGNAPSASSPASGPGRSSGTSRPTASLGGTGGARPAPAVDVPAAPGQSSIAALQAPDGAAQATVRSMASGQSMAPAGGLSLYAQMAASPGPLPSDTDTGNPYVTFVILAVFGIGVCCTGRRRVEEDAVPAFAVA